MNGSQGSNPDRKGKNIFKEIAPVYGKIAVFTLISAMIAIVVGFWIDRMYQTFPLFLILILIISIPLVFWQNLKLLRKSIEENFKNQNDKNPERER